MSAASRSKIVLVVLAVLASVAVFAALPPELKVMAAIATIGGAAVYAGQRKS